VQGLQQLGWTEGRNTRIDRRWAAGDVGRIQAYAKELVSLQPNVILARTTPATAAILQETRTIPIVFVGVADPIGSGFITSLARPDGNLTGLLSYEASIIGKWLAMLKEIAPHLARAALVGNPKTSAYDYFLRMAEVVAPTLAIELVSSRVESAADIERAIEALARLPNGGGLGGSRLLILFLRLIFLGLD
jgi:putative ABC transport system substrate-binding protein